MQPQIVLIGSDGDAVGAVGAVLAGLPAHFPAAVVVVHPRHEGVDDGLVQELARHSAMPVTEPDDRDDIVPGRVYVAPAGYHLLIDEGTFSLSREPPIDHQRPAPGPLFDSAAEAYRQAVSAILLTRRWESGAAGMAKLDAHGASTTVVPIPVNGSEQRVTPEAPAPDVAAAMAWISAICESRRAEERP